MKYVRTGQGLQSLLFLTHRLRTDATKEVKCFQQTVVAQSAFSGSLFVSHALVENGYFSMNAEACHLNEQKDFVEFLLTFAGMLRYTDMKLAAQKSTG